MIEIPVGYPLLLCYQNDTISSNLFILHQPDKLLRGPPLQTPAQVCRQKIAVMVIPVGIVVGKLQDRLLTVFVLDKGFVRLNKCESRVIDQLRSVTLRLIPLLQVEVQAGPKGTDRVAGWPFSVDIICKQGFRLNKILQNLCIGLLSRTPPDPGTVVG